MPYNNRLLRRLCLSAFVAIIFSSVARGDDIRTDFPGDPPQTSYQSGYGDTPGFGGPSSVSEELRESNETRSSTYQFEALQTAFGPWFDWKRQLNEKHGFTLGVNAYWLYQGASGSMTDEDDAFGGIYRLQGSWTAFGRGTDNAGSLEWRIENRSKAFTDLAPQSLATAAGITAINTGFGYSDNFATDLAVFNWTQRFNGGRSGVAVGRLAFDAYLDAFPFQTFSRGFINRSFLVIPTLATTGIGALGIVAKGFVSSNIWLGGQIYDGNAVSGEFDRDTFEEHEWLKSVEIGWTPSIDSRNRERIQFTWWEKDARREAGISAGKGWTVSATYQFNEQWQPFVRLGHSDGGAGVAAEDAVSIGLEMKPRMDQAWSIGLGWAKPSRKTHGAGLDDETVIETSYKFQLSPNFSLTPDLQYVRNPAKNLRKSSVVVGGVRAILTL
ncbi:MAG: carbohydrate porin [Halioglobus sp.]